MKLNISMKKRRLLIAALLIALCIMIIVFACVLNIPGLLGLKGPFGGLNPAAHSGTPGAAGTFGFTRHSNMTSTPLGPGSGAITANFGSRQDTSHPISSDLLGMNASNFLGTINQASGYLHQANFQMIRVVTDFATIFPTPASATDASQQNWNGYDHQMQRIVREGFHPILMLGYAPTWMQPQNQNPPQTNECLVSPDPEARTFPSHVKPVYIVNGADQGIAEWSLLATQAVAHMDRTFPGLNPDYEIWNEPDGVRYMCVTVNDPNPQNTKLTYYRAIYAAAAPRMKAQGQRDNVFIRVGGPALAFVRDHAQLWFPTLVKDPAIYPYLDFISYHHYFGNPADTWNVGRLSLFGAMQDPSDGVVYEYEYISSVVHAGRQPNARGTPIYIDEFNTYEGISSCCRYSMTYGPLWLSLFVADLLNSVNDTGSRFGAALAVPSGLLYFALSASTDGFCLIGSLTQLNCAVSGNMGPYPPYYAFQLLGDPNYLGIANRGYITSPATTSTPGLVVSDIYTASKDDILIVNTSGQSYLQFGVLIQNPGPIQTKASVYTLSQAPRIATQQVSLTPVNNGYEVVISVPAYSTVGLSMSL